MVRISGVIITYNEEKNIARCIDSLESIVDDIVVVDSLSRDKTREICMAKGVRFVEHPFRSHIDQKNFAVTQAQFDYILSLDADEYLSEQLRQSILKAKESWPADAYRMNRLSSYGGRWIRHASWYPDRKLRLWDRRLGVWGGDNPHDKVLLHNRKARVIHLKGDLFHEAYDNASDFLEKVQAYSDIFSGEKRYIVHSPTIKIIYKTTYSFFYNFILKFGFLGGFEGIIISVTNANYTFYKYSKLHELNRTIRTSLIVTTYNRSDALELVLLSIMKQNKLPDEVIIADDGSGDETRELIQRYAAIFPVPLIHCWHEDNGFRLAAIRNKAIARAKEEYIIMIDGDMVLPPEFVADHRRHAWKGQSIQGSRVLLLQKRTSKMLMDKKFSVGLFDSGISNRLNALKSRFLSSVFSYRRSGHTRVRGANLSFWREDVLSVNGFNEDFAGWGREDSEFAVRMTNAGIRRKHIKFGGYGYHLYHPEHSRKQLPINDAILSQTIELRLKQCWNGIVKLSPARA